MVARYRHRFVEAGEASLVDGIPGPGRAQAVAESQSRADDEQLQLDVVDANGEIIGQAPAPFAIVSDRQPGSRAPSSWPGMTDLL